MLYLSEKVGLKVAGSTAEKGLGKSKVIFKRQPRVSSRRRKATEATAVDSNSAGIMSRFVTTSKVSRSRDVAPITGPRALLVQPARRS